MTALHWACKKNNLRIVKMLVENGADINEIDYGKRTPLYLAV